MTRAVHSWLEWDILRRTTLIPPSIKARRVSGFSVAGPIVTTILVLRGKRLPSSTRRWGWAASVVLCEAALDWPCPFLEGCAPSKLAGTGLWVPNVKSFMAKVIPEPGKRAIDLQQEKI